MKLLRIFRVQNRRPDTWPFSGWHLICWTYSWKRLEDCFVILFDESLNKKVQQKQLDIHLRFWNGNEVQSRYFTSIFMGHARAVDIEEDLKKGIESLQKVQMDEPSVNWKVFEDLQSEIQLENGKNLLNFGSCGLYVIHGAYRSAMSETG